MLVIKTYLYCFGVFIYLFYRCRDRKSVMETFFPLLLVARRVVLGHVISYTSEDGVLCLHVR